ncbi:hypothetical protein D3C85_427420 [compost metagenome]
MQAHAAIEVGLQLARIGQLAQVGRSAQFARERVEAGAHSLQFSRTRVLALVQGADGDDGAAVPEAVEDVARLLHGGPHQQQVGILEIDLFGGIEVFIADIAPADEGDPAVDDPGLVVHAPVQADGAQGHFHGAHPDAVAVAARIEDAHIDQRMAVEREDGRVLAPCVDIVEQYAHAHAAVGRAQQFAHQQASRDVVMPDVVLQVETAARFARAQGAQGERFQIVVDQGRAAVARALRQLWRQHAVEQGGIDRHGQGRARRPQRAFGEAPVAVQGGDAEHGKQGGQQQQFDEHAAHRQRTARRLRRAE